MGRNSPAIGRVVAIAIGVVLIFGVVGHLWVSALINDYLRGADFRKMVEERTSDALRATVVFSPFSWLGASVHSDGMVATGRTGNVLRSAKVEQLRADVNWRAAMDGVWRVDAINGVRAKVELGPAGAAAADAPASASALPGLIAGFLPKRFELGGLTVDQADITLVDAGSKPTIALLGSALSARPDGAGWALDGRGGTLNLPSQPPYAVSSFRSRAQDGIFYVTDAQLRSGEAGTIVASGEFSADSVLNATWERVDIKPYLPADWRDRLSGVMRGDVAAKWGTAGLSLGTARGTFFLTDGLLQNLPVLDKIANFTSSPQFKRMPLQEVSGTFLREKSVTNVSQFVAESKGLLRVEGACTITDAGGIDGTFRVGVTPQTLQWIPGSRERVFTTALNGYLWTDVRVTGTLANPNENLSKRLVAAMANQAVQTGIDVLKSAPDNAKDGVKTALDLLTPLIP
jgi:hypothetical protein